MLWLIFPEGGSLQLNHPVVCKEVQATGLCSGPRVGAIDYNETLQRLREPLQSWGDGGRVQSWRGALSLTVWSGPGLFSATDTSGSRGIGWGGLLHSWGLTRVLKVVFFSRSRTRIEAPPGSQGSLRTVVLGSMTLSLIEGKREVEILKHNIGKEDHG